MRHSTIVFAMILAAATVLPAEDQPAPPPAIPPANTDAVKGTAAEPVLTVYQKGIEQADEDFQKKVQVLQQEYLRKVDFAHKTYVTVLRNAQATETRKGNLDAAIAMKNLADAVEASGPPVAPAVEGAKRELVTTDAPAAKTVRGGKNEWTVLFRSADPSIWNTGTNKGLNCFALPLKQAPPGVQYLKLAVANGACVIIPMRNELLGENGEVVKGKFGWRGDGAYLCKAYHLGIYSAEFPKPKYYVDIQAEKDYARGWGFGHHCHADDRQCFSWAGEEIAPTVFEISVKTTPLTEVEKANLKE